ncbi:CoA ester lyase [Magnetospirillum sp. UT-4]|uniref:HpcH/HpaI aldolase/citrate lyase family protein n=1 Tax=Magnetospirillum sp. UT-4 TaxID=2681467 RepID=UPI001382C7E5|nr:CoA ester lyase [Magnetospirillum sp. UT-4]CAA7623824.1 (3S)-malyl-CoA thioesterase [Magnetospirillum sp. UT-4]
MTAITRPRRSVLYMPGSNARALEKARTLAADGLILDLEDSVAPDAKELARAQVCDAVRAGGYGGRELLVRVNGLATPWGQADIAAAAASGAHAILIPKVESADAVRQVEAVMDSAGAPADMAIWCMMETPRGILKAEEIALSSRRLGGFVMGTSDLAKDLHCLHTPMRLPMVTSLSLCLLAARAHGLAILDGVYLDLNDDEGFAAACRQGLEMGFDGKTLIHPKTVDTANAVFAPSAAEIQWSKTIIAAHAEASAQAKGVVVVDGKLIENLHVENARRIVALADQIAALEAAPR